MCAPVGSRLCDWPRTAVGLSQRNRRCVCVCEPAALDRTPSATIARCLASYVESIAQTLSLENSIEDMAQVLKRKAPTAPAGRALAGACSARGSAFGADSATAAAARPPACSPQLRLRVLTLASGAVDAALASALSRRARRRATTARSRRCQFASGRVGARAPWRIRRFARGVRLLGRRRAARPLGRAGAAARRRR